MNPDKTPILVILPNGDVHQARLVDPAVSLNLYRLGPKAGRKPREAKTTEPKEVKHVTAN